MKNKFQTILLIALSIALGYSLASRPANAYGTGMWESAYRMANSLEKIEQHLSHYPNR